MSSPLHILRRPTALVVLTLVVALVAALVGVPATRAVASTPTPAPTPAPTSHLATPAAPAEAAKTAKTAAVAAAASTYTVSKAVYSFLTAGLGLPLGASTRLSGTASGSTVTLTAGNPTKLGVPAGVAMPAFGSTKIVITPGTNTLTASATAAGSAPATLSVRISHANTSTLPSGDLSARLSLTASPLGANVTLAGALTDVKGAPSVSLTGTLPNADTVAANVVTIAKGAALTATTTGGLQLNGQASVGTGATAAQVAVAGAIPKPTTWTLKASAPTTAQSWSPFATFTSAPKFTGSITDTSGHVVFDLTSPVAATWAPHTNVGVAATSVEFANTTPPAGAPTGTSGHAWIDLAGTLRAAAGSGHTLDATGGFVVDAVTGAATLTGKQTTNLVLTGTPAATLTNVALHGTGTVTSSGVTTAITGTGSLAVGSATPVNATIAVTDGGVLVTGFSDDLSAFGFGPAGTVGEILWAAAPVPAYSVASTGKTISLPAGYSPAAGTTSSGPTPPTPPQNGTTYSISAGAEQFLNSLGLNLGSTTLSGSVAGDTLTLTAAAPSNLPITLPAGDQGLTFGLTTLVVDTAADTLTVTASASAAQGTTGTLSVTLNHASTTTLGSADLQATVSITGLSVFGTAVDLTGSLTYADGKTAVALSGTLDNDVVVKDGVLTIDRGTSLAYSTEDGLAVNGSIDLGSDPAKFTVAFTGSISDLQNWSLSVTDAGNAPSFTPVDGLTITPNFTGTLSDTNGTIGFDVSGDDLTSWSPTDAVQVAVNHIEVSNQAPAAALTCPADLTDGQIWADVSGSVTYAPAGSNVSLKGSVEACIAPTAKRFTLTGAVTGTLLPATSGFSLDSVDLRVDGDVGAKSFTVTAKAHLTVQGAPVTVGITFGNDGTIVAGGSVDLSSLGLPGTNGYALLASKAVKNFDAGDLGIHNADGTDIPKFDLPAGLSVTMAYQLSDQQVTALEKLGVPLDGATVRLTATLSTSGFALKAEVDFGSGDQGLTLINTQSGIKLILDTLYIDFDAATTSTTLSLGGTAYLEVPSVVPNAAPSVSAVEIGINGTINVDTLNFSIGVSLTGACGTDNCTWPNAFGIQGLSFDSLSGQHRHRLRDRDPDADDRHQGRQPRAADRVGSGTRRRRRHPDQPRARPEPEPATGQHRHRAGGRRDGCADAAQAVQQGRERLQPAADQPRAPAVRAAGRHRGGRHRGSVRRRARLRGDHRRGQRQRRGRRQPRPGEPEHHRRRVGRQLRHRAGELHQPAAAPRDRADVGRLLLQRRLPRFDVVGRFLRLGGSRGLDVVAQRVGGADGAGRAAELPVRGRVALTVRCTLNGNGFTFSASGYTYLIIGSVYLNLINISYSADGGTIWRDLNNDAAAVAAAFVSFGSRVQVIYHHSATARLRARRRSRRPSSPRSGRTRRPSLSMLVQSGRGDRRRDQHRDQHAGRRRERHRVGAAEPGLGSPEHRLGVGGVLRREPGRHLRRSAVDR